MNWNIWDQIDNQFWSAVRGESEDHQVFEAALGPDEVIVTVESGFSRCQITMTTAQWHDIVSRNVMILNARPGKAA